LPVWRGELYLERHQGTLTTQANTKRYNREIELKLRATEMVCSALPLDGYPSDALNRIWRDLLLHQFHDILPGSSINRVYQDAEATYQRLEAELSELLAERASQLATPDAECLTVINTLSCAYHGSVELPGVAADETLGDGMGESLPSEPTERGVVVNVEIPPLGCRTLRRQAGTASTEAAGDEGQVLENDLIRYEFDEDGLLARVFD